MTDRTNAEMSNFEMSTWEKRRDAYQEWIPGEKGVMEVIREVAIKHGLTMMEMVGAQRSRPLVRARQEAYYRCRRETLASLPMIGRYFGNRDHSTILKGAQKYAARLTPPADDSASA